MGNLAFPGLPSHGLVHLGRKCECVSQIGAAAVGRVAHSGLTAVSVPTSSCLVEVEDREKFSVWLS